MVEKVGVCHECNVEIFCMDGFLNGMIAKDGKVYCFECAEEKKE